MEQVAEFDDPDFVSATFAGENGLLDRARAWHRHREGPDLADFVFSAVAPLSPNRILEVGAGTGEFALRMATDLPACVVAIDSSARMVEIARAGGVDAQVADVQKLPFPDRSFDLVVANYVLFLVRDLQAALQEIARVISDSGCLVAATQTEQSLPELWTLLGAPARTKWSFSSENGAAVLGRWFSDIEVRHAAAELTFSSAREIVDFVTISLNRGHLAERVPPNYGTLRATTHDSVFIARRPRREE